MVAPSNVRKAKPNSDQKQLTSSSQTPSLTTAHHTNFATTPSQSHIRLHYCSVLGAQFIFSKFLDILTLRTSYIRRVHVAARRTTLTRSLGAHFQHTYEHARTTEPSYTIPMLGEGSLQLGWRIEKRSRLHRRGLDRMSERWRWIVVDGETAARQTHDGAVPLQLC